MKVIPETSALTVARYLRFFYLAQYQILNFTNEDLTSLDKLVVCYWFCHILIFSQVNDSENRRGIQNGQSRETDNIWYTRYRTKTHKTKNTPHKTKSDG